MENNVTLEQVRQYRENHAALVEQMLERDGDLPPSVIHAWQRDQQLSRDLEGHLTRQLHLATAFLDLKTTAVK